MKKISVKKVGGYIAALVVFILLGTLIYYLFKTVFDSTSSDVTVDLVQENAEKFNRDEYFVVGFDVEYPPMGFKDTNGEIVGFDIDLAKAAASEMGKKIKLVPVDWGKKDEPLNKGEIDVLWSGAEVNEKRKKIYDFSQPYLVNHSVAAVLSSSDIKSPDDLGGKVASSQTGSTNIDLAKNYKTPQGEKFSDVIEYGSLSEQLQSLLKQESDAVLADESVLNYYAKGSKGKFRIVRNIDKKESEIAVIVKKGNGAMVNAVDKALGKLKSNGEYDRIYKKWFGKEL